jgi:uncharacterized protein
MRNAALGAVMRHAIVAIFAVLLAIGPAWAQSPQPAPMPAPAAPPAESLAAARKLIQAMKATDQFKALLPVILQGLKPAIVQGRPNVEKDFNTILPVIVDGMSQQVNQLADMLAEIYARNFSADEIHDLIAFYQTPTGQKLLQRQSVVARESMAAGQQWGRQLFGELKQRMDDELRKRGDLN